MNKVFGIFRGWRNSATLFQESNTHHSVIKYLRMWNNSPNGVQNLPYLEGGFVSFLKMFCLQRLRGFPPDFPYCIMLDIKIFLKNLLIEGLFRERFIPHSKEVLFNIDNLALVYLVPTSRATF